MNKLTIVASNRLAGNQMKRSLQTLNADISVLSFTEMKRMLEGESPDCLLLYSEDPNQNLESWIQIAKTFDDNLPILVLHPSHNLEDAVRLMKGGIYDYFALPPDLSRLQLAIQNALRLYALTKRVFLLENHLRTHVKHQMQTRGEDERAVKELIKVYTLSNK